MVNFKCENETMLAKSQKRRALDELVIAENSHDPIVFREEYALANAERNLRIYEKYKCGAIDAEQFFEMKSALLKERRSWKRFGLMRASSLCAKSLTGKRSAACGKRFLFCRLRMKH